MQYKIVFDAYHLYHLPQFEPVIDLLKNDDRFEIFLTTSAEIDQSEKLITQSILNSKGSIVILGESEEQRSKMIRDLDPHIFICGWSRYPLRKFVTEKTIVGMIYHGIGVKPSYWKDNHSRLNVRFVEGPLRIRQLQNAGVKSELCLTGYTKLDPLFNGTGFDKEAILLSCGLSPAKPTILYAPTFYPSSLKKLLNELVQLENDFNIIIKPHSWVYYPQSFSGVNLFPQLKLLKKLSEHKNICVLNPKQFNIVPFLYCADVLISEASSAIYEMMALNKPVLLCTFYSLKWNHALFKNRLYQRRLNKEMSEGMTDFCIKLHEPEQLKPNVMKALDGYDPLPEKREFYKSEMLYQLDGKAAHRVRDFLLEKLNAN